MKWLWAIMAVMIVCLQFRLWVGEGSFAQVWQLNQQIEAQQEANNVLKVRNDRLMAEVRNLREPEGAIEERARTNMGLIRKGETFFLVVQP
ncbi:cell division protein FtsB [Hydrocarboniclastica marina]|uniref:Cell division protein FtsB n=1 Tax=Hydrocarboniclastica marina TaxID=2259620 RepID=A0A4P7XH73_9ALTE|nr:cell division protein FtsB [Hydrocarboniclastica marina]MAL98900.1 cell division protein FtsB [Alteromonadaceae bacterium]QCF26378.1 cell division protein FtsB [Hydrocarboniclastica marina]|tara:strand:- start:2443 stop:2715 length:273 start_codon:yes stop_codon:yes gene_type:complete